MEMLTANCLLFFGKFCLQEDIEDEEPWAPQDIRGAVRTNYVLI